MNSNRARRAASSAFATGSSTFFLKLSHTADARLTANPTATVANHFPTFAKNAPTATTAFHARSAHPAIVFQNSCHRFGGGGGGETVQFPPFTMDVFATSFDTSHAKPRVWNSEVTKNGNAVTFPVLFWVLGRST